MHYIHSLCHINAKCLKKMIFFVYRKMMESASCENETKYLIGFVVCLVLLIVLCGVIISLLILKGTESKQGMQGKIYVYQTALKT